MCVSDVVVVSILEGKQAKREREAHFLLTWLRRWYGGGSDLDANVEERVGGAIEPMTMVPRDRWISGYRYA